MYCFWLLCSRNKRSIPYQRLLLSHVFDMYVKRLSKLLRVVRQMPLRQKGLVSKIKQPEKNTLYTSKCTRTHIYMNRKKEHCRSYQFYRLVECSVSECVRERARGFLHVSIQANGILHRYDKSPTPPGSDMRSKSNTNSVCSTKAIVLVNSLYISASNNCIMMQNRCYCWIFCVCIFCCYDD